MYWGGSAWRLQRLAVDQGRELYLYDTFEGLPYQSAVDQHPVGHFCSSYELVRKKLIWSTVIKGVFPASAVPMPPVAFAHLDCDQYQSVKEAAQFLIPRMVQGGIIWFDDSPLLAGARQAVLELFERPACSPSGKHYVVF